MSVSKTQKVSQSDCFVTHCAVEMRFPHRWSSFFSPTLTHTISDPTRLFIGSEQTFLFFRQLLPSKVSLQMRFFLPPFFPCQIKQPALRRERNGRWWGKRIQYGVHAMCLISIPVQIVLHARVYTNSVTDVGSGYLRGAFGLLVAYGEAGELDRIASRSVLLNP